MPKYTIKWLHPVLVKRGSAGHFIIEANGLGSIEVNAATSKKNPQVPTKAGTKSIKDAVAAMVV